MIEAGLVLSLLLGLAAFVWLAPLVSFPVWLGAGIGLTVLGLLVGIPTGVWYHVRLHACLRPRDALPPRWWLRPVELHGRLTAAERALVMRWFYAGGAGFVMTALGCALVAVGVAVEWFGREAG